MEKLREIRSYVIVGAFVVAAIVTPPDVVSQLMLAIPLCLLYEVGIFAAQFVEKRKPAVDAGAAAIARLLLVGVGAACACRR